MSTSSQNIRSSSSAFEPFQRKSSVSVFTDIQDDPQLKESIITTRKKRKLAFNVLREMFKCNVTNRILPCLNKETNQHIK